MDFEILSELIANLISFLFSFFGEVDLSPLADALETVTPYLKAALYFLPVKTIAQIFSICCAIYSLRLIVKTIMLIWNLLPIA